MSSRLSSIEVKRQNRIHVCDRLLRVGTATKPELAADLKLSIPTVSMICDELTAEGLAEEAGMRSSGGGRRAMQYRARADHRLAAGIDITRNHVYFAVIDLRGKLLAGERIRFPFANTVKYMDELLERYHAFLEKEAVDKERLLGTGIAVPGIIRRDQSGLEYSHVLEMSGAVVLNDLAGHARAPERLRFFNDATAACMAECFGGSAPESFCFLSLSNSVGGAMVIDGEIIPGSSGRGGELGHVTLVPGGRKCYCGKEGHYDAYGSALLLTQRADGSMQGFFDKLEAGDKKIGAVFEEYLRYLALMIYNTHIRTDLPVVLGGYVGSYLKPYLGRIRGMVSELDIFNEEKAYILSCDYNVEASAVGAATYFAGEFLRSI